MMKPRLVVKVGTSILTNGEVIALERIKELCKFLFQIRQKYNVILVSSGAVASGHTKITLDKNKIENRQALASIGQPLLMEVYRQCLEKYQIISAQFLLTGRNFDSRKYTDCSKNAIDVLLENGILPIINENDSVAIDELIVSDNDKLSAYTTHYFDAQMLVILSDVYGYFDENPLENQSAKLIKYVKSIKEENFTLSKNAGSKFGTGGIVTKLIAADFLLKNNKSMFLCSGFDLKPSLEFLLDDKHTQGTLFSNNKGIEI